MLNSWPGYRSVPVLTKVARPKAVLQSILAFFACGAVETRQITMRLENGQHGKILSEAPTMSNTMLLYL